MSPLPPDHVKVNYASMGGGKNLFGAERAFTLLCGDHLTRGRGEKNMANAIAFALVELFINVILVWELVLGGGRNLL